MPLNKQNGKSNLRSQRGLAIFLVLAGLASLSTQELPGSALSASGMILYALCLFYSNAPSLHSTPKEIYQAARKGTWVTPKYIRIISFIAFALIITGCLLQFRH
jgi:hypothetical protein